jgi:hypothetical protein
MIVVLVIAVVLGMMLFSRNGGGGGPVAQEPEVVAAPSAPPPSMPSAPEATPPGRDAEQSHRPLKIPRSSSSNNLPSRPKPKPAYADPAKIEAVLKARERARGGTGHLNRTGDWVIEDLPVTDDPRGRPKVSRSGVQAPTSGQGVKTTKGDWVIEEAGGNTRPAAELKLADPGDPKSTKKGDWELEVD